MFEKVLNKKLILKQWLAKLVILLILVGGMFLCYFAGHANAIKKIGKIAFTESQTVETKQEWKNPYDGLLNKERAYYICNWSNIFKVDTNLVVSILLTENPADDPTAISKINENGTFDIGYFQLNSKYACTTFKDKYWDLDKFPGEKTEFDPLNWQHNTYVALRLLKDLTECFNGDLEKIAAAYNCGTSRTLTGDIPQSTQKYVASVSKNYKMLNHKTLN